MFKTEMTNERYRLKKSVRVLNPHPKPTAEGEKLGLTMLIDDTGPMLLTEMSTSITVGFTAERERTRVSTCDRPRRAPNPASLPKLAGGTHSSWREAMRRGTWEKTDGRAPRGRARQRDLGGGSRCSRTHREGKWRQIHREGPAWRTRAGGSRTAESGAGRDKPPRSTEVQGTRPKMSHRGNRVTSRPVSSSRKHATAASASVRARRPRTRIKRITSAVGRRHVTSRTFFLN